MVYSKETDWVGVKCQRMSCSIHPPVISSPTLVYMSTKTAGSISELGATYCYMRKAMCSNFLSTHRCCVIYCEAQSRNTAAHTAGSCYIDLWLYAVLL